ncbi:3-hydroxyacyl-CoA dehydrogenase [Acidocella aquatica]|uniref:3-hydroxyacyl-CoA dehydrogenase n=1 Tax=Acidocella aquatica TaxID=1922313 RepID=A0ABQ6A8K6_9PROT|nr:SDR family NAD(P)-dependent oxidoreductase [Acidocella aquatica]GLR68554.1 3-hydroxyacyl-CoA dehydrogenase [Acidocella aquatica]
MEFQNVAAVVTGGASGLGAATARRLAARGCKVALFDMNEALGTALAGEIGGMFCAVDITSDEGVAAALDEAAARHGTARILVNCAGISRPAKTVGREFAPAPLAGFRQLIEINLVGTFNVISKFAARLAAADPHGDERGVIINTASVAAFEGQVGQASYAASKGGVAAMTLPISRDLAPHGIRVMTIAPGLFLTPMLLGLPQDVRDSLGRQVPFPSRLGKPEEYAMLVESIITNPMLNGETIRLDGAIRMGPK